MDKLKKAITLDKKDVRELYRLVNNSIFQNCSQAIQEAVSEKLQPMQRTRPAEESARLDPKFEKN